MADSEALTSGVNNLGIDLDFSQMKKVKKNKNANKAANAANKDQNLTMGEDNLLSYENLLNRIYNQLRQAKPQNWDQKANKSITIAPPMCQRFGKKKSIYGNFTPNCNSLNRDPSHVQEFIANELSTTANLKSGGQLVLQGIYDGKHLQQALKKYVKNFVRCNVCESTNTSLSKGNRMTFLVCTDCKSQRTVETIKPGN